MKIIKVTKCKECPYRTRVYQKNGDKHICLQFKKIHIIWDTNKIPDWCPLEANND